MELGGEEGVRKGVGVKQCERVGRGKRGVAREKMWGRENVNDRQIERARGEQEQLLFGLPIDRYTM